MDKEGLLKKINFIKETYRFEIIKEMVTDKIAVGSNVCVDFASNVYVNGADSNRILIYDSALNELCSFEQRFVSVGHADFL